MKTLRERLLSRAIINFETGCWEWEGCRNRKGYGQISVGTNRMDAVHRVSYTLTYGPIPRGLQIDHLCRVRHCLNPAHLEAVTPRVNVLRGESLPAANSAKSHCDHGHEFTPENTYLWRGFRFCRVCKRTLDRESKRRISARKRAAA